MGQWSCYIYRDQARGLVSYHSANRAAARDGRRALTLMVQLWMRMRPVTIVIFNSASDANKTVQISFHKRRVRAAKPGGCCCPDVVGNQAAYDEGANSGAMFLSVEAGCRRGGMRTTVIKRRLPLLRYIPGQKNCRESKNG